MNRRRRANAFTLLEAMVTLAMMAIVATAAVAALVALQRMSKDIGRQMAINERLRAGLLYLGAEIRNAGGMGILPHGGVIVEDECGARDGYPHCRGSDRLTLVQGITTLPGCKIERANGNTVQLEKIGNVLSGRGEQCCYVDGPRFRRQAAIVSRDRVEPVLAVGLGDDCRFRLQTLVPDSALARGPAPREGSQLILADIKTFYVEWDEGDDTIGDLKMHVNLDGDGSLEGERLTVMEDVADLQVALGFNSPAGIVESADGTGDTWYYNGPGEHGLPRGADIVIDRLRIVGVSVIAAASGDLDRTIATPWGPRRRLQGKRVAVGTERTLIGED